MSDKILESYIRQLLESQRAPEVTVAWQGGEPTLTSRSAAGAGGRGSAFTESVF